MERSHVLHKRPGRGRVRSLEDLQHEDQALDREHKAQLVNNSGLLEMCEVTERMEDIGGLDNLKDWMQRKARIIGDIDRAQAYGVSLPKGVLIAGLPGCGKSLNAKAAANIFGLPLLRMDIGRLMGKFVGDSEGNMRRALALAESVAPCVLWIDELEKAFAGVGSAGGNAEVTTRLFGVFLTWLQEKKSLTFVVATVNQIDKMPAELMRKGRFDEIFYIGLPKEEERRKIFEIHIKKHRPQDLASLDIDAFVRETEGYSGADIEGILKESIERAFVESMPALTTDLVLQVISETPSLQTIMKKAIEDLTKFYEENHFKNASK